jgi:hypothetical protein
MEDGATSRFNHITVGVTNRKDICEGKPSPFQKAKKNVVSNVKSLIKGHWHELSCESSEIISCQPESAPNLLLTTAVLLQAVAVVVVQL